MVERCYICKKVLTSHNKTREHIIPRAIWQDAIPKEFDEYQRSNILPACSGCNDRKSSSILMLPISTDSWWPIEYSKQLEELQIVFEYLLKKIVLNSDTLKLRSGYFRQWLTDFQLYRMRGVSKSEFDKRKCYVSTKNYMNNDKCRRAWWS